MSSRRPEAVQPSDLSFDTLCSLFDILTNSANSKTKSAANRRKIIDKFIDTCVARAGGQAFCLFRLCIPALDAERGNYRLQEGKLVDVFIKACGVARDGSVAKAAKGWKKPGVKGVGIFARVMEEHFFSSYCEKTHGTPGAKDLKIRQVNEKLDAMVACAGRTNDQAEIVRWLFTMTTPKQMFWLTQIILKNLRINMSETTLFKAWHPDAVEYYNKCGASLRAVFNTMIDPSTHFDTGIIPGRAVRPQLALGTGSVEYAFKRMQTKQGLARPFLLETKFDGERIQVHRDGNGVYSYFSRRGIEHGQHSRYSAFDPVLRRQLPGQARFILDGEMVVWNRKKGRFEPFGGLKTVMHAAGRRSRPGEQLEVTDLEGLGLEESDPTYSPPRIKDVELVYIAFDIVYLDDRPTTHLALRERHRLLAALLQSRDAVAIPTSGVMGRVVPLLPGETRFNDVLCSREGRTQEDIQEALDQSTALKDEGIVIKALDSMWTTNDRSGSWLKIKLDYVRNMDIDAVIVGGWYGQGRRGDAISQFLLALAVPNPVSGEAPSSWLTFCRVGTGVTDEERASLNAQLKHLFLDGKSVPPPCLQTTGREAPDVWIKDPSQSVVLEVHADLRTIPSSTFATKLSLRFPAVHDIRWDKVPCQATTDAELRDRIREGLPRQTQASDGTGTAEASTGLVRSPSQYTPRKRPTRPSLARDTPPPGTAKRPRLALSVVGTYRPADTSDVQVVGSDLADDLVHFAGHAGMSGERRRRLERGVAGLGGRVSQNLVPRVTLLLADGADSLAARAAIKQDRDLVHTSWLEACMVEGRAVAMRPRHYVHLSSERALERGREYGDAGDEDLTPEDVEAMLERHIRVEALSAPLLLAELRGPGAGVAPFPSTADVRELEVLTRAELAGVPGSAGRQQEAALAGSGAKRVAAAAFDCCVVELARDHDGAREQGDYLRASLRLMGAWVDEVPGEATGLLVCLRGERGGEVHGGEVLEALQAGRDPGTGLEGLRARLSGGACRLVDPGWVDAATDAVLDDKPMPDPADYAMAAEPVEHWPWARFLPSSPPSPAKPRAVRGPGARGRRGPATRIKRPTAVVVQAEGGSSAASPPLPASGSGRRASRLTAPPGRAVRAVASSGFEGADQEPAAGGDAEAPWGDDEDLDRGIRQPSRRQQGRQTAAPPKSRPRRAGAGVAAETPAATSHNLEKVHISLSTTSSEGARPHADAGGDRDSPDAPGSDAPSTLTPGVAAAHSAGPPPQSQKQALPADGLSLFDDLFGADVAPQASTRDARKPGAAQTASLIPAQLASSPPPRLPSLPSAASQPVSPQSGLGSPGPKLSLRERMARIRAAKQG
ncbi:LIG4 [Auxenochlorella protothecoides x Auxenochlorella symbiontica]